MPDFSETDLHERVKRLEDENLNTTISPPEKFENPPRTELISSIDDLPAAVNGEHLLEDNRTYKMIDAVESPYTMNLGDNNHLTVENMNRDRFVYTGTGTAIKGRGVPFNAVQWVAAAPMGQMLDLEADNSTEFYYHIGNLIQMQSLGRVSGFRVPAFKSVNLEAMAEGIAFDGGPDKIFFDTCLLRNVTASNVDLVTLKGSLDVDIVKFIGDYIKYVQPDTTVVNMEDGAFPNNYFKYINVDHNESSMTRDSIFKGFTEEDVGVVVENSFPLEGSSITGELHIDRAASPYEISITNTDEYVLIDAPSILEQAERVSKPSEGKMEFLSRKNSKVQLSFNGSFYGSNGDIYRFAIQHNDHIHEAHTNSAEARGQNANVPIGSNALDSMVTGDTVSLWVKNETAANDLTILDYTFSMGSR